MIQQYRLALAVRDEMSANGMWPDKNGDYVKTADHREAVRELVKALEAIVSDVNRIDYHAHRIDGLARAAIAKAGGQA